MKRAASRILVVVLTFLVSWDGIHGNEDLEKINRTPAQIEDYPFIVSIALQEQFHYCGGVIISDNYVLTSAYCLKEHEEDTIDIFCGTQNSNGTDAEIFEPEKFLIHKDYDYFSNDIALIRIQGKFEFSSKIQPINIANADFPIATGDMCMVAGWGDIEFINSPSDVLLKTEVPIYDHEKCKSMYEVPTITDNMLCVGFADGVLETCKVDTGGPLVLQDTLVGVASFRESCSTKFPGIYTDVRKYYEWINDVMQLV